MDKTICGIDVSKDRLDVAVRPSRELFAAARTGAGLDDLVARLKVLKPNLIVLEATGGFETVAVAALAAAGLPIAVANPATRRPGERGVPIRRTPLASRPLSKPPSSLPILSPAGARSST